ncbi:MAG: aquaporin [Opitutus sp.]|nr:aquaporin [Opitutus sp.]
MTRTIVPGWLVGEFAGTFLLVFFGCGSVAASVLLGAQVGIFQVAIVWGLGIAVAIFVTGSLSGAHLNPAVTCALATCGGFPARRVAGYVAAQIAGAFFAAAVLHAMFTGPLQAFETANGIVRGAAGSEASAMIFGEYFPNPGGKPLTAAIRATLSPTRAFLVETVGTAVLVLVIFAVTDERNTSRPRELTPVAIGLTVTLLISLLAPLTQACFNPARDFGPRLWSAFAGWGRVPFSVNDWGWLTIYVFAPLLGGQVGAAIYRVFLRPAYATTAR